MKWKERKKKRKEGRKKGRKEEKERRRQLFRGKPSSETREIHPVPGVFTGLD